MSFRGSDPSLVQPSFVSSAQTAAGAAPQQLGFVSQVPVRCSVDLSPLPACLPVCPEEFTPPIVGSSSESSCQPA